MNKLKQFVSDHKVPVAIASTTVVVGAAGVAAVVLLKQDAARYTQYCIAANDALEKLALGAGVTEDAIKLAVADITL